LPFHPRSWPDSTFFDEADRNHCIRPFSEQRSLQMLAASLPEFAIISPAACPNDRF
jgi:hypothetical protein